MILACVYDSKDYKVLHITNSLTDALDKSDEFKSKSISSKVMALTPTTKEYIKFVNEIKINEPLPESLVRELEE